MMEKTTCDAPPHLVTCWIKQVTSNVGSYKTTELLVKL